MSEKKFSDYDVKSDIVVANSVDSVIIDYLTIGLGGINNEMMEVGIREMHKKAPSTMLLSKKKAEKLIETLKATILLMN